VEGDEDYLYTLRDPERSFHHPDSSPEQSGKCGT